MTTETINYLDEGFEYLRLTHELTANIRPTDEVVFEIGFGSSTDPWTNKEKISEDVAICKMARSTTNTVFWTQTAEDKYYNCSTKPSTKNCEFFAFD